MNKTIDAFNVNSGWTTSGIQNAQIMGLNQIPEFIANEYTESTTIRFSGVSGHWVNKSVAVPVSCVGYDYGIIHIACVRGEYLLTRNLFDFATFSITFNDTMTPILMESKQMLLPFCFSLQDISTIDYIKIKCIKDTVETYFIVSSFVITKDDVPLNIYESVKSQLDTLTALNVGVGLLVGELTGLAGEKQAEITGNKYYLDKYACFRIDDGVNHETHAIEENDEVRFRMNRSVYDGESLLHDYSEADVYLTFPVMIEPNDWDIKLPALSIYGDMPEEGLNNTKIEDIYDTYTEDGSAKKRRSDQIYNWKIRISGEARHLKLLEIMSKITRDFIARNYLWVNNRKFYITFDETPQLIRASESYNEIPRIEYVFRIEIQEEIWARGTDFAFNTLSIQYDLTA